VLEPAKFLDVLTNLEHAIGDIVYIPAAAKEDVVRQPDGFLIGGSF
jgi:hypothetical protein